MCFLTPLSNPPVTRHSTSPPQRHHPSPNSDVSLSKTLENGNIDADRMITLTRTVQSTLSRLLFLACRLDIILYLSSPLTSGGSPRNPHWHNLGVADRVIMHVMKRRKGYPF